MARDTTPLPDLEPGERRPDRNGFKALGPHLVWAGALVIVGLTAVAAWLDLNGYPVSQFVRDYTAPGGLLATLLSLVVLWVREQRNPQLGGMQRELGKQRTETELVRALVEELRDVLTEPVPAAVPAAPPPVAAHQPPAPPAQPEAVREAHALPEPPPPAPVRWTAQPATPAPHSATAATSLTDELRWGSREPAPQPAAQPAAQPRVIPEWEQLLYGPAGKPPDPTTKP